MSPWFRLPLICLSLSLVPIVSVAQVAVDHDSEVVTVKVKGDIVKDNLDLKQVAELIIQQTNKFRESEKRPEVKTVDQLTETTRYFADYMARTNRYGHIADGTHPNERAKKHGYEYCIVSENIAYEYSSQGFKADELAKGFTEGWKHSPGHRKNMLDPDVTETGVAVAWSSETGHYFAVQMFGRPKSQVIEFSVANESDIEVKYKIGDQAFPLPHGLTRTHQICRPTSLTFIWSDKPDDVQVIRPNTGEQLVVSQSDGKFQVKQEQTASE